MKALVLASGGVDSTTCLGLAVNKYGKENVIALTVAYGQKHTKEIEAARKTAEYYGVEHLYLDLEPIFRYSDCSLLEAFRQRDPARKLCRAAEGNRWFTGFNLCAVPERIISFLGSKYCAVKKLQCDLLPEHMRMMQPEMHIRTAAVRFTMRSTRRSIREAAAS